MIALDLEIQFSNFLGKGNCTKSQHMQSRSNAAIFLCDYDASLTAVLQKKRFSRCLIKKKRQ